MKKILSVILAATIILSLLPSAFAAEANAGKANENTFFFSTEVHGNYTVNTLPFYKGNVTPENTDTSISDPWGFVNQHYSTTYCVAKDYLWWQHNRAKGAPSYPSNFSSIALEIIPDVSGTFDACLTFITETSAVQYDVYLFEKPADVTDWYCNPDGEFSNTGATPYRTAVGKIPASARIGHFDAYGNGEVKSTYFPNVTVEKNKTYYLVFAANGANEKWVPDTSRANYSFGTLKLKSFTLSDLAEKEELPTLTYNITADSIKSDAFETVKVAATANTTVDNSELALVSWRDVYYAVSSGTVIKKAEGASGATKSGQTLDLSKTDPFELQGRSNNDNSPSLGSEGFVSQFYTKRYDASDVETANEYAKTIPSSPGYTVRINVPKAGMYSVSILNNFAENSTAIQSAFREGGKASGAFTTAVQSKVYVAKAGSEIVQSAKGYPSNSADQYKAIVSGENFIGWYDSGKLNMPTELGNVYFPSSGEYFVSFHVSEESLGKNSKAYHRVYKSGSTVTQYIDFQLFVLSGIKLTPVDNAELAAADEEYNREANVNPGNGTEVATTIENAEVKAVAADVAGNAIGTGAIIPAETVAVGSAYKADAPEIDGYKFIYWAKGIGKNRKIVSFDESYSFKATSGGTLLMAVYAKIDGTQNTALFYNGNGQVLSAQTGAYTTPELPSMAGFGKATHWTLGGSGEEFAAGASGEITRMMNFVAQYGEIETVKVTVTNGSGGGNVNFGSSVTVKATERLGTDIFGWWENENGEIVSFDLNYTFKALRDTTVKAVYNKYAPNASDIRKIVMTKDGKNVFAEFIGIENVIERGILFGADAKLGNYEAKVTMNTDANEFAAYNDIASEPEAIGYAILSGGKVIYSK